MTIHAESRRYVVSLKHSAREEHSPQELVAAVESVSGDILQGRGHAALTVAMSPINARRLEDDIDFADIREYQPLQLLKR